MKRGSKETQSTHWGLRGAKQSQKPGRGSGLGHPQGQGAAAPRVLVASGAAATHLMDQVRDLVLPPLLPRGLVSFSLGSKSKGTVKGCKDPTSESETRAEPAQRQGKRRMDTRGCCHHENNQPSESCPQGGGRFPIAGSFEGSAGLP